ncbi:hypothetical protein [Taibaiella koreensis]|uniref:hypothetical protein n=1 Tax=Taibaiella koreensis TaxID=1268548 RepID=UPI000E59DA24|nr:hypothetical protein [Taibaiella koreensis]
MQVDKREAELIEKAIVHWREQGIVDEPTAVKMKESYALEDSDSNILSIYALIACVSCGLLAFGALVMDEKWIELVRRRFGFSEVIVGICFILLSAALVYLSYRRRCRKPGLYAANEAFNITIVLGLAVGMAYIGRSIGYQNGNYAPILLVAALLYGSIAVFLRSQLLWATLLLALAGWWGAQTYYWSHGNDYFLQMNYALRMSLFGALILLLQQLVQRVPVLMSFARITRIMGWVFFLVAAWSLSILGNSSNFDVWLQIRQGRLWVWALAFSLMLLGLIVYAFRRKDAFLRDICLIFFLINIYTRYFEYFWDKTNKGLFFAILAFSFWWIGRTAERWRKKQVLQE